MYDVALFKIGFKCESIAEAVKAYAKGEPVAPRRIDESLEVINDCFAFMGSASSYFSQQRASLASFMPLVFDLYPGENPTNVTAKLTQIRDDIVKIGQVEEAQPVERVLDFFQKVSALCLRRSARVAAGPSLFHA